MNSAGPTIEDWSGPDEQADIGDKMGSSLHLILTGVRNRACTDRPGGGARRRAGLVRQHGPRNRAPRQQRLDRVDAAGQASVSGARWFGRGVVTTTKQSVVDLEVGRPYYLVVEGAGLASVSEWEIPGSDSVVVSNYSVYPLRK